MAAVRESATQGHQRRASRFDRFAESHSLEALRQRSPVRFFDRLAEIVYGSGRRCWRGLLTDFALDVKANQAKGDVGVLVRDIRARIRWLTAHKHPL